MGACAGTSECAVGERRGQGSAAPGTAACDLAEPHLNYFQAASCSLCSPWSHQAGCQQSQQLGRFLNADCMSVRQAICTIWHPRANPGEGAGQWGKPKLKCHLEGKHQLKRHKAIKPNNEGYQGWGAGELRMAKFLKPLKFHFLPLSIFTECLEMLLCRI